MHVSVKKKITVVKLMVSEKRKLELAVELLQAIESHTDGKVKEFATAAIGNIDECLEAIEKMNEPLPLLDGKPDAETTPETSKK